MYSTEQMQEEHDKIGATLERIQSDNKIKVIAKQLRFIQFEKVYFGQINAFKKRSMEAQK